MVATAIYSVTMVLWKETAFPLCRAMERRWKRTVVSRVSSVIVVILIIIISEYYYSSVKSKKLQERLTTEKIKPTTESRRIRTGVRLSEIKRAAEEQCLEPLFDGSQRWRRDDIRY